jgi:predicted RNase H-like HicB family nuclease
MVRKRRRGLLAGLAGSPYTGGVTTTRQLTAILTREGDGYVALCPELDVASQGSSMEEARGNLIEALELFLETADPTEVRERLSQEVLVTRVEVRVG